MRKMIVKCIVCQELVGAYHAYDEDHCCEECWLQTQRERAKEAAEDAAYSAYRDARGE